MHPECKAPPERQVFSHSFSLSLLCCVFLFFSCQVSTGMFQRSCAYLRRLEKVRQNLHWRAPPRHQKGWRTSYLSCSKFMKKRHKLKKHVHCLRKCYCCCQREQTDTIQRKNNEEFKRQPWPPLLWPIRCWFWPTRPNLDLSPPAASLTRGRSHLMPPLSPLHKQGHCTAKLLGSFSKSSGRVAVTHLVQAWGIMDFQQEGQPLLRTENISVNKLVFHFAFDTILEY